MQGGLRRELLFYFAEWRLNLRNQMALRGSFGLQVAGMFLSNLAFFIIWMSFSHAVGALGGWGVWDTFGLVSVSMLVYGATFSLCGSLVDWETTIPDGRLDVFLVRPKSIFFRLMNQRFHVTACGDLIQGLLGVSIYVWKVQIPLAHLFIFLPTLWAGSLVFIGFFMVAGALLFYLPQGNGIASALENLFVLPTTQPLTLIQGPLRVFYLLVVPSLVVAGVPMEVLKDLRFGSMAIGVSVAAVWFFFAWRLFYFSLRRYESGNGVGV